MNQRTYEIISKWVAEESGVKVSFEDGAHPHANPKEKTIVLPTNIEANDPWAAMSTLVHEAAHIKHSHILPKHLSRNAARHNILNAIEDIRIDQKNFHLLPNVHEWYRRSAKEIAKERKKMDMSKVPLPHKVLVNSIFALENLREGIIQDQAVEDFRRLHRIDNIVMNSVYAIENKEWNVVEQNLTQIMNLFGLPDPPADPKITFVIGMPAGNPEPGEGDVELNISGLLPGMDKSMKSAPGDGTTMGNKIISAGAINDITKNKFRELLNIKEKRTVFEGNQLNHDNLILFHLGDPDELFIDDDIIKKKKSKMMFVIDASGSMEAGLMDGSSRKGVTLGTVRHLVETLRDVMAEDSLEVDYQIAAFTGDYHPLSKENWEKEYQDVSGGTDLGGAFKNAVDDMLSDTSIDGSKIIVLFTDGDVYPDDVKLMEQVIFETGGQVKYLLVGVGSDFSSDYVLKLIGDNNILTKDSADAVLMDAIAGIL